MLPSGRRCNNVINEFGELPLHVQPKMLNTLEAEKLLSFGSDLRVKIATRAVAATCCDADAMVQAGTFRQDLLKIRPTSYF